MVMPIMVGLAASIAGPSWIRNAEDCAWGFEQSLRVAIQPGTFKGAPRGLIHLMYPTLKDKGYDLVNFIAVEPIVGGKRGYSEMERSTLDGVQGLRMTTSKPRGVLTTLANGVEKLSIPVEVEKFGNGAHVRLELAFFSNKPGEVQLTIHAEPGSAPIEQCILTATMGNKSRARILFLKNRPVYSVDLWPNYKEKAFTESIGYPLDRIRVQSDGSAIAAILSDEKDPRKGKPVPGSEGWGYRGFPITQYWKTPAGADNKGLDVWVNGRYTYWAHLTPIPGGIAYENFELRAPFVDGQAFVFGITPKTPKSLGFSYAYQQW